ncbi:MAG: branched-chain amino acid ABC transporter permease [Candidatus Omnitrophica bacterium]|nr:branched-chain amino acid ABC transporter permease [Candidatus Omnitrophota bacterium]
MIKKQGLGSGVQGPGRKYLFFWPLAFGLFLILPLIDHSAYHQDVLVTAGIYILLALGLNMIVGYAGLLNLGYAAFFGIGAYTCAGLNLAWHIPFWLALPVAVVVTGFFGFLVGLPVLRVKGDYLAIVTLGFGEIVRIVFNNLDPITGGPNGLLGIEHPVIFYPVFNPSLIWKRFDFGVSSFPYYYLVFFCVILVAYFSLRLDRSRIGRAWIAVREDEVAAGCMGIPVPQVKLLAFGVGSSIAGIAGSIFAAKQGTITPDSFDFILSVMILAMVVLGGMGSVPGVILGGLVLSILPELLREFSIYRMLIFGLVMILMMIFRPQGFLGNVRRKYELTTR